MIFMAQLKRKMKMTYHEDDYDFDYYDDWGDEDYEFDHYTGQMSLEDRFGDQDWFHTDEEPF